MGAGGRWSAPWLAALAVGILAAGAVVAVIVLGPDPAAETPDDGPSLTGPGDRVTMPIHDRDGRFGTVELVRGEVLTPDAGELGGLEVAQLVEIRIRYEPTRAATSGYGAIDWFSWSDAEPGLRPVVRELGDASLPSVLPGHAEVIEGAVLVPLWEGGAAPISIAYAPDGGQPENEPVWRVIVHRP